MAERQFRLGAVPASDIESFTTSVEALMTHGADGLHWSATAFNTCFCTVADAAHRHGGDVLDTAGDPFGCR